MEIIIKKHKVIIEFDGSYWHKDKADQDLVKTKILANAGCHVIRVRERSPKKVTPDDIVFRTNNIKQATDKVLSKIDESYDLGLSNLQRYLKRKTKINKKAAEIYIDKLLSEKYRNGEQ